MYRVIDSKAVYFSKKQLQEEKDKSFAQLQAVDKIKENGDSPISLPPPPPQQQIHQQTDKSGGGDLSPSHPPNLSKKQLPELDESKYFQYRGKERTRLYRRFYQRKRAMDRRGGLPADRKPSAIFEVMPVQTFDNDKLPENKRPQPTSTDVGEEEDEDLEESEEENEESEEENEESEEEDDRSGNEEASAAAAAAAPLSRNAILADLERHMTTPKYNNWKFTVINELDPELADAFGRVTNVEVHNVMRNVILKRLLEKAKVAKTYYL